MCGPARARRAATSPGALVEPGDGGPVGAGRRLVRTLIGGATSRRGGGSWTGRTGLNGGVVHGDHRGRELGYPTANLGLASDGLYPPTACTPAGSCASPPDAPRPQPAGRGLRGTNPTSTATSAASRPTSWTAPTSTSTASASPSTSPRGCDRRCVRRHRAAPGADEGGRRGVPRDPLLDRPLVTAPRAGRPLVAADRPRTLHRSSRALPRRGRAHLVLDAGGPRGLARPQAARLGRDRHGSGRSSSRGSTCGCLRAIAPAVYVLAVVGLAAVLSPLGSTVNGSRSWIRLPGRLHPPAVRADEGRPGRRARHAPRRPRRPGTRAARTGTSCSPGWSPASRSCSCSPSPTSGRPSSSSRWRSSSSRPPARPRLWTAAVVVAGVAGVAVAFLTPVLSGYQRNRLRAFLDPSLDPQGIGYQTRQVRIAIASGGLDGEGLFHGSQTQAGRIPFQETDFVFSVAGEELGVRRRPRDHPAHRLHRRAGGRRRRVVRTPSAGSWRPGWRCGSGCRPSRTSG